MYEDMVIRDELYELTPKKFELILLLCRRIQQLDQGNIKAIDTRKTDFMEIVVEEASKSALLCEVVEPEPDEDIVGTMITI